MTSALATLHASAIGRSHRAAGRSGQDAAAVIEAPGLVTVCVADGCSAGRCSELGASVGARCVVAAVARRVRDGVLLGDVPRFVVADLVAELRRLAHALTVDPADAARVVEEYLLFTVQAAVIVAGRAVVFGVGDGVVSVDGVTTAIDQGAAPDYPAYALFDDMRVPRVCIHHDGPFARSIAVGTDGVAELLAAERTPLADGRALGGLAWFERDQSVLKNRSLAQKRLNAWCQGGAGPHDDCTLAVVRRIDVGIRDEAAVRTDHGGAA